MINVNELEVLRIGTALMERMRSINSPPPPRPEDGAAALVTLAAGGITALPVAEPRLATVKWGITRFLQDLVHHMPELAPMEVTFADGSELRVEKRL